MPLRAISLFTYRTSGGGWTRDQLGVLRFVRAIKKESLGGDGVVEVNGELRQIQRGHAERAFTWFAEMVLPLLKSELGTLRLALVPVPDSDCVHDHTPSRTKTLADAVAKAGPIAISVYDVIRWRQKMPSAHASGGSRDPEFIYNNLCLRAGWEPLRSRPHVLIDDVVTKGGHLRACKALLEDRGANVVLAVCAAKADKDPDKPFERRVDHYEDLVRPKRSVK